MEKLPPEILGKIAGHLSARDLVSFSGTNQMIFETVSSDKLLWQRHLDEARFPSCSVIQKQISTNKGNCHQKEEYLVQKRLAQNWRTGNFKIETVTEPCDKNFHLGCKYNDFVLWTSNLSKNSWKLFWFDTEDGFHTGTYSYQALNEEAWLIPEFTIEYVGAVTKKHLILHLHFYPDANVLCALDITGADAITELWRKGPIWSNENDDNDGWKVQVINETVFVFKAPNRNPSIDFFDAASGKLMGNVVDPLLQNGYMEWFGVNLHNNREVSQRQNFLSIGWYYITGHRTELLRFDVDTKSLQLVETDGIIARFFGFDGPTSQFGDKVVFNVRHLGKRFVRVVDLKDASTCKEKELSTSFFILSRCQYNFMENGNFFVSEANDDQTSYKVYRMGTESCDQCEIPLAFDRSKPVKLHQECLIACGVENDNATFLSFYPFPSSSGTSPNEIRRPLLHPYQDSTFRISDLVVLPSLAIAKFRNRSKSSFWMLLNFVD